MTNINETVAGLELALASASSMIERLTLERDIARDELAALVEHCRSIAKDAARYRWLRSNHPIHDNSPFICRNSGASFSQWTGEHADSSIDAAMQKGGATITNEVECIGGHEACDCRDYCKKGTEK